MAGAVTTKRKDPSKPPLTSAVARGRSVWILNPWADLALIVGSPMLVFLGITAARGVWSAGAISAFVMIWAIGHHLPGMMRAYGDPLLFRRFRVRFVLAPVFLMATCAYAFVKGPDGGVLTIAAAWGWWHYLMQTYGFVRIYDSKVGSFAATTRWLDKAMCISWFAAAVILNDNALYGFVENLYVCGISIPSESTFATVRSVVMGATAAVTVLFAINVLNRIRSGQRPSPIKIILMATTFSFFWYSASTVTNIVVAYALFEIFHDIQYLTIVWAFNRNRVIKDSTLAGFTRFVFQPRVMFVGLYLLMIFGYGSLKVGSEWVTERTAYQFLTAVFMTSTLLHYYFDGFIWKLSDKSAQASLGITDLQTRQPLFTIPTWLRHGLTWCLFIIPFLVLSASQALTAQTNVDQKTALEHGRHLAECTPGSIKAQFNYALVLEHSGDLEKAIEHYQQALDILPDYDPAAEGKRRVSAKLRLGVNGL